MKKLLLLFIINIITSKISETDKFNSLFIDSSKYHPEIDKIEKKEKEKIEKENKINPQPDKITNFNLLINARQKRGIINFENLPEMQLLSEKKQEIEKNPDIDISDMIKSPTKILGKSRKLFNYKKPKRKLFFKAISKIASAFMSKAEIASRVKKLFDWKNSNIEKIEPYFLNEKKNAESQNDKISDKFYDKLIKVQQKSNKAYEKTLTIIANAYNKKKKEVYEKDLKIYKKELKKNRPFKIKQIRNGIRKLMKVYFRKFMSKNKFNKDQFKKFRREYMSQQNKLGNADYQANIMKKMEYYRVHEDSDEGEDDQDDDDDLKKKKVVKL